MKIAYFSPLNPQQSGISDFSEELLQKLKEHVEITVFVDDYVPSRISSEDGIAIRHIHEYDNESVRREFDTAVFHIGNNLTFHKNIMDAFLAYGGILELHDISIHNMIAGDTLNNKRPEEYVRLMKYCHGEPGEKAARAFVETLSSPPWENDMLHFTMNRHLLDRADGIIVHSDMAKQMVKATSPNKPVECILLHSEDILSDPERFKLECRRRLNIRKDKLVFGSFGYATHYKRILPTLEALAIYKKSKRPFHYYMVGKVDGNDIEEKIKELKLESDVTITGFTELDDFKAYMGACDVCFNLRYPTQGETSASLHRMLGMGKPVIVTDVGSFQEYPDDFVLKVRYDTNEIKDICLALLSMTDTPKEISRRGKMARDFAADNCGLVENAKKYAAFFEQVINGAWQESWLDSIIDRLEELKMTEAEQVRELVSKFI